ncbi:annexin A6-like isoform X2 [Gigantopelta aegis]|uniref:annexin A6-like isoform X2 n=1 Tax=Gigantopelta aegis TaxID=1735272 RepID=UPI001B88C88A|nr:annexin A6-like isoform X2 [Gigantopelta aegis]
MPRHNSQFPAASKILSKYEHDRALRLHKEKINNVKPGLDNKPPKQYPHLMVRMKTIKKEEERLSEVDRENKLLLQKMIYIMKTRGRVDNWNMEYEPGSLNRPYKQRELEKIATENLAIARRLENAKPVYKSTQFEEEYQRSKHYQSLHEDTTKEYEDTPRRSIKSKSVDFEEEKKYEDDFESDEDEGKKKTEGDDDKEKTDKHGDKDQSKKDGDKDKSKKDGDKDKSKKDSDKEKSKKDSEKEKSKKDGDKQKSDRDHDKDKRDGDKEKSNRDGNNLPQIEEKKKSPHSKNKSESSTQKLPPIEDKKTKKTESPAEGDAKQLFRVAKQLALPDEILIKTLVKKSQAQRLQTKAKFHELYDLDLDTELKDGLGKDWHPLIDALLSEHGTSECEELHKAIHSGNIVGIMEVLCSTTSSSLAKLKDAYRKEYAISLESDIAENTKNPVQCLLLTLQKEGRDDSTSVDKKAAEKNAKALLESGDGRWDDQSGQFIMLVAKKSIAQVKATLRVYKTVSGGMDAIQAVREECDSDYADAINAFMHCAKNPQNVYAEKLYKNLDASNPAFVNTLVERSEIDMPAVRKAYRKKYDADLIDDIKDRCVHPTSKVLIELVQKTPPAPQQKGKGENGKEKYPKKQPLKRPDAHQYDDKNKNNPLAQSPQKRLNPNRQRDGAAKEKDKKKEGGGTGTVCPAKNFDPDGDVEKLHAAMTGLGTDEEVIMLIVTSKSNEQRQQLRRKYYDKYKKHLLSDLKSELTGDYEKVIMALMLTPVEYDAHCLHVAVDGLGTNETALIELLTTRSSKELEAIKKEYKSTYKSSLDDDLKGDTSGGFKDMLLQLSQGKRDTGSNVNADEANADANRLCKDGGKTVKLNVEIFKEIILKKNPAQIKRTFEEYKKISKQDIYAAIKEAMSGDSEEGYLGLAKAMEDHILFFAEGLHTAFAGMGTNEERLIRIVVSRSEVDLGDIKAKYKELYGKSLSDSVKDECSGDLGKTLLALIGDK